MSAEFRDTVTATDEVTVTVNERNQSRHPCPRCGAETKEHRIDRITGALINRICSRPGCRVVSEP